MSFWGKIKKLFEKRKPEAPVYIVDDGLGIEGTDGDGDSAVDNESGLTGFRYGYNGSIGGGSYSLIIKKRDAGFVFEYDSMEHSEMGELSAVIGQEFIAELDVICKKHRIARWNGFSKYAKYVCDGDGFSLSVRYADGKNVSASGTNAYPSGFHDFADDIRTLFAPLIGQVLEDGRQRVIAAGIKGEISSYLVNFSGQGAAAGNKYNFFVTRSDIRDKNVDIVIDSESGEIFPKGKKRYYCSLPDEAVVFSELKELVEKYRIIEWYGYEKTAVDYANREWFQLSVSFENVTISAMGTEPPPRYEDFRRDFLTLQKRMIERAVNDFGMEEYK